MQLNYASHSGNDIYLTRYAEVFLYYVLLCGFINACVDMHILRYSFIYLFIYLFIKSQWYHKSHHEKIRYFALEQQKRT